MSDTDTNIDDLFDDEPKASKPKSTKPKQGAAKPKAEPKPKAADEPIDTAVRIRRLDWECECGNTNTHELTRCGKCHTARYR